MKHPAILRFVILLLLLILVFVGFSQTQKAPMIWMEGVQSTRFNDRFSTTLLFQRRVFFSRENTYQHIYWASGNYRLNQKVMVGGGLIYFTYHKKVGERFASVPETRPFQFVTLYQKVGNAKLSLRSMAEERFLSQVIDSEVFANERFNMRYRFRLRGYVPIVKNLKLELSNEVFFNGKHLDVDAFAQNRAVGRLKYSLGQWSLKAGYMHWSVNTSKGIEHRPSLLVGASHRFSITD